MDEKGEWCMAVCIACIDKPRTCYGCVFDNQGYCYITNKKTDSDNLPEWCPLEEIENDETIKALKQTDVSDIIEYLNATTGSRYRATTPKTKALIRARFNEGFTIDDFKTVIDKKVRAWSGNEKMQNYLRPETLFGTKFESYLNEQETYKLKGNTQKESSFQRIQRLMQEGAFEE